MPNYKKLLSTKVREDGRSQIIVRVDVSRTNRPQLKTGVWVLPDLFDAKKGGIDIPKRSKLNMPRYEEATKVQAELDDFCLKVSKIINAGEEAGLSITREWIERVIAIGFDGTTPIEELHIPGQTHQLFPQFFNRCPYPLPSCFCNVGFAYHKNLYFFVLANFNDASGLRSNRMPFATNLQNPPLIDTWPCKE